MEQGTKDKTTSEKSHQNKDTHFKDQDTSMGKHKSPVITHHLGRKLQAHDSMEGISWQDNQLSPTAIGGLDLENDDILDFEIPESKERSRSVTFAASLDIEDPRKKLQRTPTPYWADSCDVDDADVLPIMDDSQKVKTFYSLFVCSA